MLPNSIKTASGLKLAHLNIRSLNVITMNKIDQVRILLEDKTIDVLALSETWLMSDVSDEEVYICGYTLYRKKRVSDQRGGGVTLYIESSISHSYSDKLTKDSNSEVIWVAIELPKCAPFGTCSLALTRAPHGQFSK